MNQPLTRPDPGFSTRDLRRALGMFATGVTIVTALGEDGQPLGVTINSFSSVSMEPPLVLWSLSLKASSIAAFRACSHYAISVLAADQRELAERFAAKDGDRWRGVACTPGLGGAPLMDGAAATFECSNRNRHDEGDHTIFIGQVERCVWHEEAPPLLFLGGRFLAAPST